MSPPIRPLPLAEPWDCHACGDCCRAVFVALSDADVERLRAQRWDRHPDFRGVRIMVRQGLFKKAYRLALRKDGTCVFLTPDRRCRIHQEHGEAAKPLLCRMYPFQLVPLEDSALVTLRRNCPSAAAGNGRPIEEHLEAVCELAAQRPEPLTLPQPPPVTRRHRLPWRGFLRVTERIERLMLDDHFPHVRRLVHAVLFCQLLEPCRLDSLTDGALEDLLSMLEASAVKEAGALFVQQRPPQRAAAMLFRQILLEYTRLHPKFVIRQSLRERWRLIVAAAAFARGRGRLPRMHDCFPENTFEALERPLGHLGGEVLGPLAAYFDAAAASKQYALLARRHWPLVESFRALALSHAVAMWMLRLSCGARPPGAEDMIGVVGAIDRGQHSALLAGYRHRRRLAYLARTGDLARLIVRYAR